MVRTPWISARSSAAASRRTASCAGPGPADHLGDHRVVVGADLVAGAEPGVHPDPVVRQGTELHEHARDVEPGEPAALRPVVVRRVLGVEPHLDGVPGRCRSGRGEPTALGDPHLLLDEVEAGEQLGDRVLDLEPGVHLQEPEPPGGLVVEELHRAGADVADRPGRRPGRGVQRGPGLLVEPRGGRLLDDLLVPALHRAVPVPDHLDGAVRVTEHLHLDVPPRLDVRLAEHRRVAERGRRLGGGLLDGTGDLGQRADDAHAATAAARGRLHQQGKVGRGHLRPGRARAARARRPPPSASSPRPSRPSAPSTPATGRPRSVPRRPPAGRSRRSRRGTRSPGCTASAPALTAAATSRSPRR